VQRLGATWLDYHTDGLAEALRDTLGRGADAVVDLVGDVTLRSSPGLLEPGGRIASVTDASEVRQLGGRYLFVRPDGEQLHLLARWVDEGRLRIHVSETFALTDAAAALRQQQDGHVTGKLVLRVDSDL
jgi:NADPH2:quinone reductase